MLSILRCIRNSQQQGWCVHLILTVHKWKALLQFRNYLPQPARDPQKHLRMRKAQSVEQHHRLLLTESKSRPSSNILHSSFSSSSALIHSPAPSHHPYPPFNSLYSARASHWDSCDFNLREYLSCDLTSRWISTTWCVNTKHLPNVPVCVEDHLHKQFAIREYNPPIIIHPPLV